MEMLISSICVQVMRYPERGSRKHLQKKKSVRVCLSKAEEDEKAAVQGDGAEKLVQTVPALVNEKAIGSLQTEHFEDAVCQLAQLCLVHVNEKNSEKHLVFLSLLLQSFHTPRLFSVSQKCAVLDFLNIFFFISKSCIISDICGKRCMYNYTI